MYSNIAARIQSMVVGSSNRFDLSAEITQRSELIVVALENPQILVLGKRKDACQFVVRAIELFESRKEGNNIEIGQLVVRAIQLGQVGELEVLHTIQALNSLSLDIDLPNRGNFLRGKLAVFIRVEVIQQVSFVSFVLSGSGSTSEAL